MAAGKSANVRQFITLTSGVRKRTEVIGTFFAGLFDYSRYSVSATVSKVVQLLFARENRNAVVWRFRHIFLSFSCPFAFFARSSRVFPFAILRVSPPFSPLVPSRSSFGSFSPLSLFSFHLYRPLSLSLSPSRFPQSSFFRWRCLDSARYVQTSSAVISANATHEYIHFQQFNLYVKQSYSSTPTYYIVFHFLSFACCFGCRRCRRSVHVDFVRCDSGDSLFHLSLCSHCLRAPLVSARRFLVCVGIVSVISHACYVPPTGIRINH